ncbi:glycosyltransferase family 2 protein [Cohnella fermenti]|nr:glycosyltransferase family 2 protein [Cohnella fermenti]
MPTVSVIMAAYQAEAYIEQAVQSVLAQSYSDLELLVIDDGSSDRTSRIVAAWNHPQVRLYTLQGNRGPSYCRNYGIGKAAGRWIAVLDADDWWHHDRLRRLIEFAERFRADIVCDDLFLIRDGEASPWSTYLKTRVPMIGEVPDGARVDAQRMIQDDFGYLKPMVSAEFLRKRGIAYKEDLRYGEDFRFVLECLLQGASMRITEQALYYYRIRDNSLSSDVAVPVQAQIRSTEELMHRYSADRTTVRALSRYAKQKRLILTELDVKRMLRQRKLGPSLAAIASRPAVLRPLLRNLIRSWR